MAELRPSQSAFPVAELSLIFGAVEDSSFWNPVWTGSRHCYVLT